MKMAKIILILILVTFISRCRKVKNQANENRWIKPHENGYADMAENMSTFQDFLQLDSVNVIGYSDGGVVGNHLAAKYPAKVKKRIAVGANTRMEGLTKETREWIISLMKTIL